MIPPWRSPLSRALHRNRSLPNSRYVQLATIRQDGRPANRTLVFRGFLDPGSALQFVTDSRSEKINQIHPYPWGELCWYFPQTREQFRISGSLTLVTSESSIPELLEARQRLWQSLSDASRLQFAWPSPGQRRSEANAFSPLPADPSNPLPNFGLLLLHPTQVDHLELRGMPQNRSQYRQTDDQDWLVEEVNP